MNCPMNDAQRQFVCGRDMLLVNGVADKDFLKKQDAMYDALPVQKKRGK